MNEFTIKLSGIAVRIRALYLETGIFCKSYMVEEEPVFSVETTPEDIQFERKKSMEEAAAEGRAPVKYTDFYLETLAVYRKLAERLIDYDILLFHGSVIAVDGKGYLFAAPSGIGKSTHARLWRQMLGDRAFMVNDDKPLLKISESGVSAWGTPWDGKHHLSRNTSVPLCAVCLLSQDKRNHIEQVEAEDVWPVLWSQAYRPKREDRLLRALTLVEEMAGRVKLYRLGCNMEQEAAEISFRAMSWNGKGTFGNSSDSNVI